MKDLGFQASVVCEDIKSSINSIKLPGIRTREVMPLLILTMSFIANTTKAETLHFLIGKSLCLFAELKML